MNNRKHLDWLFKELPDLVEKGILNTDKAAEIKDYYQAKALSYRPISWAFIIFAIIGVIFIGGGILSIVAFNWKDLTQEFKTVLAFLPTIIAQIISGFVFKKKMYSIAWRESISVFLFICLIASMALIGQIYHLASDYQGFLLSLNLISLPIIYIFRSSALAALSATSFTLYLNFSENLWALLLIGTCPFLYKVFKNNKYSPSSYFLTIVFSSLLLIHYLVWALNDTYYSHFYKFIKVIFGIYFLFLFFVGTLYFNEKKNHLLRIIGAFGLCLISYLSIFKFTHINTISTYPDFGFNIVFLILMIFSTIYLIKTVSNNLFLSECLLMAYPIIAFLEIIIIQNTYTQSFLISVLFNVYFLLLSVSIILKGSNQKELNIVTLGSFLMTLYIISKFVSIQAGLITKGIICILIGIGFLGFNYYMKKSIEKGERA